jgi:exopolysaccharide biosynthesis polyprenyl glycosylphosphotransferase
VSRRTTRAVSVMADFVAVIAAYYLAIGAWLVLTHADWAGLGVGFDWLLLVVVLATLSAFGVLGLHRHEAFVSRPLHVVTIAKACGLAFVLAALCVYLIKSPIVEQSRFVIVATFVLVFVVAVSLRVGVLSPLLHRHLVSRRPGTLVIGRSAEAEQLTGRLSELRGFNRWRLVAPGTPADGFAAAFAALALGVGREPGDIHNVFIDAASLPPQIVLCLVSEARKRGAAVYVVSRLLSPLDSTNLLLELFDIPVVRVRDLAGGSATLSWRKRLFDAAFAVAALVALAPLMALIAGAIKLTSRGPVFHVQERIGLRGHPFAFYKFRSMEVDGDHGIHRDYVCALINGDEPDNAATEHESDLRFKLVDDPRVTRVGAFLRKYSLDELPQFWNVLMGDMSLVGPRPALAYEVAEYKEWHHERLAALPGLSGLWQISGRSRVPFDEMVLEDVLYTYNQSILTDLGICLRTLGVVVRGCGGT